MKRTLCLILIFTSAFFLTYAQVSEVSLPSGQHPFTFQQTDTTCIWVGLSDGNNDGALGFISNGEFQQVSGSDSLPNGSYHTSIKLLDGSIIFGGNLVDSKGKAFLVWISANKPDTIQIPFNLARTFVNCFAIVNKFEIWIGTASGLLINKRGQWLHFTTLNGLPDNFVTAIHQDYRGIVWIGSESGLAYFQDNTIQIVPQNNRAITSVTSIYSDDKGYVWCGSRFSAEGVSVYNGEIWQTFSGRHGLFDNSASTFYQSLDGKLWVGSCYSRSRGGLSIFDGAEWVGFSSPKTLAKPCVDAIISDSQNRIWIGGSLTHRKSEGITVFDGTQWHKIVNHPQLKAERVLSFYVDLTDRLWISSMEGLYCVAPEFTLP
ncbi:MAG: two-component regulator propeller domain-containing protein [Bacteroidales bacterium]